MRSGGSAENAVWFSKSHTTTAGSAEAGCADRPWTRQCPQPCQRLRQPDAVQRTGAATGWAWGARASFACAR